MERLDRKIIEKWFIKSPRFLFRFIDKRYNITNKILCDIGCSYGMNLPHCMKGSFGIEADPIRAEFAYSLGLSVYMVDIIKDDLSNIPKADVVWCCMVLEHVDSPHIFLRNISKILKDNGIIFIVVPTIPIFQFFKRIPFIGRYFKGHLHSDHINAFTPRTIKFMCERAGYKTIKTYNKFNILDGCIYVGKKIADWQYPQKTGRI